MASARKARGICGSEGRLLQRRESPFKIKADPKPNRNIPRISLCELRGTAADGERGQHHELFKVSVSATWVTKSGEHILIDVGSFALW